MLVHIKDINAEVRQSAADTIARNEAAYDGLLEKVATDIRDHADIRPVILLAGPSGSGKTTTAKKIEEKLDRWGYETHTLSMDDYFKSMSEEEARLADEGKIDLESPAQVDRAFFTEQLRCIIAGEPVEIPRFDFASHTRAPSGWVLARKPNELVIVEGIHALNPTITDIPDEQILHLHVNVRTALAGVDGETAPLLRPRHTRLLRRILRDRRSRHRTPRETVARFASVQQGEKLYITPYQDRAQYKIDSFQRYEVGVYRRELWDTLTEITDLPLVAELLPLLEQFDPVDPALIPDTALIREFIGGSRYE